MKKIYNLLLCGLVLTSASCKKFLDVNETNPNAPTTTSVDLVLPQALAATAATSVTFNSYGAWTGGYQANAGGFGAFGAVVTYNFTTNDNIGLWTQSYDNINDYQYVINNSATTGLLKDFNAVARIMKVFSYQRLVDAYGDVPYTQAVKGLSNITPTYDKAEDIYKDLFLQLDTAIATLKTSSANSTPINTGVNGKIDIYNLGNAGYIQFANTIKLRMLNRIRTVGSLAATYAAERANLDANNFITTDVSAQPGYTGVAGKQNPAWNAYAYNAAGTASQITTVPTKYAVGFYNNIKLLDETRGAFTYRVLATANQLGDVSASAPVSPPGTNWFVPALGNGSTGTSASTYGILKGPSAPMPIMLASEGYFIQAEGALNGTITSASTLSQLFDKGIVESFRYLATKQEGTLYSGLILTDPTDLTGSTAELQYYQFNENPGEYLVDISKATTDAQRLEAIITQKWIALNYITSDEGWNEYRRTGYPVSVGTPQGNPTTSIASLQSTSTRSDKLPVRVLYPASEYQLNSNNAPAGISQFTSRIFWDAN